MSAAPRLSTALSLAEEYGLPVFPCSHNKKPLTEHGFQDADTNHAAIEAWWTEWPHALIGVPTGKSSKLLVIDVDPEGADWYSGHVSELKCARVHRTERGWHLLYRMPDADIRNSASKLAPGIDVRGEGGYIIWWPANGQDATGDLLELNEPPQWVIDQLRKESREQPKTPGVPGEIREGGRNDLLFRTASRFRRMGLSQVEIASALRGINIERCSPPLSDREIASIAASAGRYEPEESLEASPQRPIILRHISDIVAEQREADWIIYEILERGVIAVIAGPRSTFKSFIALHWIMLAALEQHPVVILSAEGAGLDRRVDAWLKTFAPAVDSTTIPIVALERAVNLNSDEVLADLQTAIATSNTEPHIILIDTFSKYSPGIDENDNGEVATFIQRLSAALRDQYGCTIVLVAHSGHGDAKRPRGASALMANPDAEYIVERPDPMGMAVSVTRDRFKDSPSLPPIVFQAESIDLGRLDRYGKPVTSLIVRQTDQVIIRKAPTGAAQKRLLAELERLVDGGIDPVGVWTQDALRGIGRSLGASKSTARDAVLGLVNGHFLIPTVGGYRLVFDNKGPKTAENVEKRDK